MSREIKFRVWFKPTAKYKAYFEDRYHHKLEDLHCSTYTQEDFLDDTWLDTDNYESIVFEQYTGLKDKNGKEIYEGDIVKCYSRGKLLGEYQVIWNEDCGGFECRSLKPLIDGGGEMLKDVRVFCEISIQFRIIGNTHENPELLGGEG